MVNNFLTLKDFSKTQILQCLDRAIALKDLCKKQKQDRVMQGKHLAMIFEKSSTRTRVSFEVGVNHLGGNAVYLTQQFSQLGRGETYADTAKVLSRYVDMIVMRTFSHETLMEMASYADVPVINGLTDSYHPCQVMADLVTLKEKKSQIESLVVSYIGDGNNMTHSWMNAADILGFTLKVATPKGYEVDEKIKTGLKSAKNISYSNDPVLAVKDCDVVNTDTWFSMGQEVTDQKRKAFEPFQLNANLLKNAKADVAVMHCLPAHRNEEITDEVIDGPNSIVFDQAENRLYAQMAIMEILIG